MKMTISNPPIIKMFRASGSSSEVLKEAVITF